MRRVTATAVIRKKDIICLLQATFKLISEYKLENRLKILFVGSLRAGSYDSYDKALLSAAVELLPEDAALEIFNLSGIPPFQDLGSDIPTKVKEVKSKIRGADVILIATPEYNLSVPEALNNAIDWASRPYGSPMVIIIPSVVSVPPMHNISFYRLLLYSLRWYTSALKQPPLFPVDIILIVPIIDISPTSDEYFRNFTKTY
jgi:hypothetical protein